MRLLKSGPFGLRGAEPAGSPPLLFHGLRQGFLFRVGRASEIGGRVVFAAERPEGVRAASVEQHDELVASQSLGLQTNDIS